MLFRRIYLQNTSASRLCVSLRCNLNDLGRESQVPSLPHRQSAVIFGP